MFSYDDDDDDDRKATNAKLVIEERARRQRELSARLSKQALADDSSIYDYDGVYDAMVEKRTAEMCARVGLKASGEVVDGRKAPRYIHKLQEACKVREIEFDRVYERQLLKEQEEEKAKYGDQAEDRFVTGAYKKQLQELRKWDAEDARKGDEIEEKTSALSAGMHGFYANLLTKNIGMGADVETSAVSTYTHGSKKHACILATPATEPAKPKPPPPIKEEDGGDASGAGPQGARQGTSIYDTERAAVKAEPTDAVVKAEPRPGPEAVDPEVEKKKRDAAVLSARERFLQRKKTKTGP
ncbi:coiled-coil domain-containing protein 55-domain containing protein [Pelagophyceae sp. CCMP2097]|nr:coiled-coil domain-containing protein 55-domain containing protein [Pelagophyceae sp. CCMP2097]